MPVEKMSPPSSAAEKGEPRAAGHAWAELEGAVNASFAIAVSVGTPGGSATRSQSQWTGRLAPIARPSQTKGAVNAPVPALARASGTPTEPRPGSGLAPREGFARFGVSKSPAEPVPPTQPSSRIVSSPAPAALAVQARDAQDSLARWSQSQAELVREALAKDRAARALAHGVPQAGELLLVFRIHGIRYAIPASRVRETGKLQASHWLKGRVSGQVSLGLGGARVVDLKKRLGFEGIPGSNYLAIETRSRTTGQIEIEAWAVDGIEPQLISFDPKRWREPTFGARRLGIKRHLPGNAPISLL